MLRMTVKEVSDKDLEQIYRQANNVVDGKRAPLTTEAVFKAMRLAFELGKASTGDNS